MDLVHECAASGLINNVNDWHNSHVSLGCQHANIC